MDTSSHFVEEYGLLCASHLPERTRIKWYVTMRFARFMRHPRLRWEVKRRLRELIECIKWKQGWQRLEASEHYFDATLHAEIQDAVHQSMAQALHQALEERESVQCMDLTQDAFYET